MKFLPIDGIKLPTLRTSKIRGVHLALVVDNRDGELNLGYRVKLKFPLLNEQESTFWARIAVPMGGSDRGTYVLPEIDDQVLVVFEHGDINRPIVVGALWSRKQEPVEINQSGMNNTKLIKSRSGHRIIFDDKDGIERIVIVDKTKKNKIILDSASKLVKIESDGDIEVKAKANVILHSNALKVGTKEGFTGKAKSLLTHAQKTFGLRATSGITIGGSNTTINVSNVAACSVSGYSAGDLSEVGLRTTQERSRDETANVFSEKPRAMTRQQLQQKSSHRTYILHTVFALYGNIPAGTNNVTIYTEFLHEIHASVENTLIEERYRVWRYKKEVGIPHLHPKHHWRRGKHIGNRWVYDDTNPAHDDLDEAHQLGRASKDGGPGFVYMAYREGEGHHGYRKPHMPNGLESVRFFCEVYSRQAYYSWYHYYRKQYTHVFPIFNITAIADLTTSPGSPPSSYKSWPWTAPKIGEAIRHWHKAHSDQTDIYIGFFVDEYHWLHLPGFNTLKVLLNGVIDGINHR